MPRKSRNTLLAILVTALMDPAQLAISQTTDDPALQPTQLNEITFGKRLHWAALQFIAPEFLHTIVPVYIYSGTAISDQDSYTSQSCLELVDENSNQVPICAYGNVERGDNHLNWIHGNQNDCNNNDCLYALNHRIPGINPYETLWMNYEDWNNAVESLESVQ